MDVNQLNTWIETEEGKQWLDSQKSGLVNKRDELLEALKQSTAKLAEQDQRSAAAEALVKEERAALTTALVDGELVRLLKSANVFEAVVPATVALLKESHAIQIKANGPNRKASGTVKGADGTESELGLADIVSAWCRTPEAKQVIRNGNTGGGALPGNVITGSLFTPDLKNISGQSLAKMSDAEFQSARNAALLNAKEG